VRGAGLEPARYFYHEPLKLACLPVPPPALFLKSCCPNESTLTAGKGLPHYSLPRELCSFRLADESRAGTSFRKNLGEEPSLIMANSLLLFRGRNRRGHRRCGLGLARGRSLRGEAAPPLENAACHSPSRCVSQEDRGRKEKHSTTPCHFGQEVTRAASAEDG